MSFWRRPQRSPARRALFQVHLWTGIAVGLYVLLISLSGAALVFRIDLQRALHPDLLQPRSAGAPSAPAAILDNLAAAFPAYRIAGIDAPTTSRATWLAYVSRDKEFLTVLLDPVDAGVLGILPEKSFARTLQNLHFDLLAGNTGRVANGIGALLLLVLCVTGAVIWWQGVERWRRGLKANFAASGLRLNWELHGATGFWALLLLAMWAFTGLYFAFPGQFRAAVNSVSPLSVISVPRSGTSAATAKSWGELIGAAQRLQPQQHVARIVLPYGPRDAFQVLFASTSPTPSGERLAPVYLDQYDATALTAPERRRSPGDVLLDWVGPLHTGNFGGLPVKLAWLVLGLAPAVLFVTGFISWWTRVVRPRRSQGDKS
jgi:uncharacterized iron-regulated membrane protein